LSDTHRHATSSLPSDTGARRAPRGDTRDPEWTAAVYRVLQAVDGRWYVLGYPWLSIEVKDRRTALQATRAAVSAWLGVEPDAFDVVSG